MEFVLIVYCYFIGFMDKGVGRWYLCFCYWMIVIGEFYVIFCSFFVCLSCIYWCLVIVFWLCYEFEFEEDCCVVYFLWLGVGDFGWFLLGCF